MQNQSDQPNIYRCIKRSDISAGGTVASQIVDYNGNPVATKGQKIDSFITEQFLLSTPLWTTNTQNAPSPRTSNVQIIKRLQIEYDIDLIDSLSKAGTRKPLNMADIYWKIAKNIIDHAQLNPSPLILLVCGNHPSRSARNSYASALVASKIATKLNWPEEQIQSIAAAALTMNLSIHELQDEMSTRRSPPTSDELLTIRSHPQKAANALREMGVENNLWIRSVSEHHEEPDGKGYPNKIGKADISTGAAILRLADRYVAMTASRKYRAGIPTSEALTATLSITGDPVLAKAIKESLSAAPAGGIWIDPKSSQICISIGDGTNGIETTKSGNICKIEGLVEIPPPIFEANTARAIHKILDSLFKEHTPQDGH